MMVSSDSTSIQVPASKKPLLFLIMSSLLAIGWYLILLRHPGAWSIVMIQEVVLSFCVIQLGSSVFFPGSAASRTRRLSEPCKSRIRLLARITFTLGLIAVFSAVILGLVFEQRHALALQTFSGTFVYLVPVCLLDLIGESSKSLYQPSPSDPRLLFAEPQPVHSSHWKGQQSLR